MLKNIWLAIIDCWLYHFGQWKVEQKAADSLTLTTWTGEHRWTFGYVVIERHSKGYRRAYFEDKFGHRRTLGVHYAEDMIKQYRELEKIYAETCE